MGDDDRLHPVAFTSRKLIPAETTYPIHEVELAAMVHALDTWRHYLDAQRFFVFTDNYSLQTLRTNDNLSARQIRWLYKIQSFQFTIKHIPREKNVVADALSKYPHLSILPADILAEEAIEGDIGPMINAILGMKPDVELETQRSNLLLRIKQSYGEDETCVKRLASPALPYSVEDGLLYHTNKKGAKRVVVPRNSILLHRILLDEHDDAGHFGFEKLYERVSSKYCWNHMDNFIKTYLKSCDSCQRVKSRNHLSNGLLQPLPIPDAPFSCLSIDLTPMPKSSNGVDNVFTVVDRLTKKPIAIPTKLTADASTLWNLLVLKSSNTTDTRNT